MVHQSIEFFFNKREIKTVWMGESLLLDNTLYKDWKNRNSGSNSECNVLSSPFPGTQQILMVSSQQDALEKSQMFFFLPRYLIYKL